MSTTTRRLPSANDSASRCEAVGLPATVVANSKARPPCTIAGHACDSSRFDGSTVVSWRAAPPDAPQGDGVELVEAADIDLAHAAGDADEGDLRSIRGQRGALAADRRVEVHAGGQVQLEADDRTAGGGRRPPEHEPECNRQYDSERREDPGYRAVPSNGSSRPGRRTDRGMRRLDVCQSTTRSSG